MDKEITNTKRPISPMFLGWSIDEIKAQWRKGTMSPFFLQRKALGPSQTCSPYNKENENGDERTPLQIHSMERWIAQWNGAKVVLSRIESLKQSRQHNITWNSLRKWCFFMDFYSMALGDYVTPLRCEKGFFRAQLGLWPAYSADSAQIWCQIDLGADPLVVGRPTNFNKCAV